jgi:regulation of enolase protein 1 (concanavalin A-like superfamily)
VPAGSYSLRAVATDADGGSASSASVTVTVTSPSPNQPPSVTLTAPANGATFTAPATITLSATASDPENRLTRVEFYNGSALLNSDSSAPYSFAWSSVTAGVYQLKAVAVDADGGSTSSATASVTVATVAPLPSFPDGQQHQDIGAPAIAGSAAYSNGTYTVAGAGANIWDAHDEFHYVYQPMSGDFEIVARIASLQGSNSWSKAGVMVRESLADNARHAYAHIILGGAYRMIYRTASGGGTMAQGCIAGTTPGWVRLIRQGSSFEMRNSTNGTAWTSCGTIQVSMASTVYVGLAVGNVDPASRATAVFDNVRITPTTAGNQPPTVSLTAPANGATFTAPASITLSATASDPENRLSKVDFYNGSTLLATDTGAPYSFTWSSVPAGSYSLRAVATDADGGSASSASVTVTVATTTTRRVAFPASVDHAIVTNYLLEVFPSTANPATATAMTSSDLGKPTPDSNNEIIVDRTTFLNNLAPGNYWITVASVNAAGKSRSPAISFTR